MTRTLQQSLATARATVAQYGQHDGGAMADAVMAGLLRLEWQCNHRKPRAPRVKAEPIHGSAQYWRDQALCLAREIMALQEAKAELARELEELRRPRV